MAKKNIRRTGPKNKRKNSQSPTLSQEARKRIRAGQIKYWDTYRYYRDIELQKQRDRMIRVGAYNPTTTRLTKSRIATVRKKFPKWEQYIMPETKGTDPYFFLEVTDKKLLQQASEVGYIHTKKGIFVEKQGFSKARIRTTKKHGTYIESWGTYKTGFRKGQRKHRKQLIGNVGDIDREYARIRDLGKSFGPMGKNDRLAFKLVSYGHDRGYSHNVFGSIDLLVHYLNKQYPMREYDKLGFLMQVVVEKTSVKTWFAEHPSLYQYKRNRKNERARERRATKRNRNSAKKQVKVELPQ